MRKPRVTDVSRLRVKYNALARCQGTADGRPCSVNWTKSSGDVFRSLTSTQVRVEARAHAFDHPGHRVYVDVLDRESFKYTSGDDDDDVTRTSARVSSDD